ncbi:transcriptional regulator [Hassallia byssoidea VB512170]|uniref:Transcriptional regulator n=1 Tax=Hassallia byssoidea VB512170 TaxID=1304833 RepID=A0A846HHY3_9CYAN|nr:transcriptional regulator [Hassalia byssoidea]NEU76210.1 transcriptional regulator [Hassalia byssoidea VB512170]
MTSTLNREEYIKLLAETLPRVIDSAQEYKRLLNEVEKLMDLGENLTAEQVEVLQLLVTVIEQYEKKHYQLKAATPHDVLHELMLARGLKQKDLLEIFGSSGFTSEVINGKRGISKSQSKALGAFFHVSPALFL